MEAKVAPGKKTVVVTWQKPQPTCPTTPSADNPGTSESLTVGEYTRTYKYSYNSRLSEIFEVECHVNIDVKGVLDVFLFNPFFMISKIARLVV